MNDIQAAAQLCVESYLDKCPDGFTDLDDLRYGVHTINDQTFITIRGTANMENALRDLWARPARICSGEWVHKGFASGFELICKEIRKDLRGPIVFTGHSFGAAVALLLADVFNARCITFGCPRPYLRLNGKPNAQHIRIRNDDDPVTMVPCFLYHMPTPGQDIVLDDSDDEIIDVKDHSMKVYQRRIK